MWSEGRRIRRKLAGFHKIENLSIFLARFFARISTVWIGTQLHTWNPPMLARSTTDSESAAAPLRLERLLMLVSLMESGQPRTGEQLAERLNVCKRTVFRDIKLLRTANVPIAFDSTIPGYRLLRGAMFIPVDSGTAPTTVRMQNGEVCHCPTIQAEEIVALLLAVKAAGSMPQEVTNVCDVALSKILAGTMPAVREQVNALLRHCSSGHEQPQQILQLRPSG
jgi:predicted DNA-binding transcriptional regulator YafY